MGFCGRFARALFAPIIGSIAIAAGLGCGDPAANVVAVWVEDLAAGVQSNRRVEIYDRGDRYGLTLVPAVPGSGSDRLTIGVDGRGRGVAFAGSIESIFQDLRDLRRPRYTRTSDDGRRIDSGFAFAGNDDALIHRFSTPGPLRLSLTVLSSLQSGETFELEPPAAGVERQWTFAMASNAPMFAWLEQPLDSPPRVDGRVVAMAYPSEHFGAVPQVVEPTTVAQGRIQGRGVSRSLFPRRINDDLCPGRTCLSPDGTTITTMASTPCAVWQWRWQDVGSLADPVVPQYIELPGGCPPEADPHLFAQIAEDILVFDDNDRVYVFDLGAGSMTSIPKLDNESTGLHAVDRGRGVVIVGGRGEVLRVDASGPRWISTEQTACSVVPQKTRVSPSGQWLVVYCEAEISFLPDGQSTTIRVSALGLEQYVGIAMRPIAIDDEGNVLLYSYDPSGPGTPRGLFVLSGDGLVARVDDLEPPPADVEISSLDQTAQWFAATAMPRHPVTSP